MEDDQIEKLLRKAPGTAPPHGLRERLQSDICLPRPGGVEQKRADPTHWIRRWLPALGLAGCLLACAVVFAVQTSALSQLRNENEALRAATLNLEQLRQQNAEYQRLVIENRELERLRRESQEVQQLRDEAVRLREQLKEIARLRNENQQLSTSLTTQFTAEMHDAFDERVGKGSERALSIQCINNLKQIGLAARIWSTDNADILPPNWLAMSNELGTPKILVCPGDTGRQPASDWATFAAGNVSYEYLNPDGSEYEGEVVLARCPVHGHVCMSNGSVQRIGKDRALIVKDGKYYVWDHGPTGDDAFRRRYGLPDTPNPANAQPVGTNSADEVIRQRYGLPKPPDQ